MPPSLQCPHCSTAVTREATVCPGCGAVKKMAGGGPSKRQVNLATGAALIGGGCAGLAVRYFAFPQGAGVGDYFTAFMFGGAALTTLVRGMYFDWSKQPETPMPVWERPKP